MLYSLPPQLHNNHILTSSVTVAEGAADTLKAAIRAEFKETLREVVLEEVTKKVGQLYQDFKGPVAYTLLGAALGICAYKFWALSSKSQKSKHPD
jgi:hypothetical protein